MNSPSVSVIVPCFNMEKYLCECMSSVLQQTLENIEVICIDDGSTDGTPQLLEDYQHRDTRVRVIHQANQGVAKARNNGLREAKGEFVAFLDPDDFYPDKGTLELLYQKAVSHNVLICGGSFSNFDQHSGRVTTCFTGDYAKYTFSREGLLEYRDYQFDFGYHRFLYNRAFLLENELFFPLYTRFQDPPFFVRAMIAAKTFYAVPDVVYRYRIGIQDKPTSWPREKIHHMMQGHLDNLILSAQENLEQLHALTVRRFEADAVFVPVMKALGQQDETALALLTQIQAAIDCTLLKQAGLILSDDGTYLLRQMRAMGHPESGQILRHSGKMQKAIVLLQYWKEFGTRRTLRLIKEKFQNR